MAHQTEIVINGVTTAVTEFDHSAQEIDDGIDNLHTLTGGATTPQGALANLGAGVRPSRIINGGFKVNQRGQEQYTGAWDYCFDGWVLASNTTATKNSNGDVVVTNISDSFRAYILQRLEYPLLDTVSTFSVLTTDGLFYVTGCTDSTDHKVLSVTTPFGMISVEYDALQYLAITLNVGQSITLPASRGDVVKFEEGSTQTLAYQDEDGNWQLLPQPESDYATQLAKCQRYYYRSDMRYSTRPGHGSRYLNIPVQFPVVMRILPTVTVKSFAGTANMLSDWASALDADISVSANAPDVSKDGIGSFVAGADMNPNTVYGFCFEASADL